MALLCLYNVVLLEFKGLSVTVDIINKAYQTGRKVAADFKEKMKILFDDYLPQWNYTVVPQKEENVGVI
ncbi:hypothetical protein HYR99_25880 [Candidatus Poribacteria bacterium]|nr:hypothetical protein [Candidatus Poribacteria bacterium]